MKFEFNLMLEPRPPTAACSDLYLLHGKDQQVSWYQIAAQQLIFRKKKCNAIYILYLWFC